MNKPAKLFVIPLAIAVVVGFLLGLFNSAIAARGGTPMGSAQVAMTSMCVAAVAFAMLAMLRGNRAQAAADGVMQAQAMQFTAEPGAAAIYVFRDGFYGKLLGLDVSINNRPIGQARGVTFFRIDVLPGRHMISVYNPQDRNAADLPIDVTNGEVAFVELKLGMSGKPRHALTRIDPASAMPRVRRCRMLAPTAPAAVAA